jgi:sigma-B regulation protein RsbQ
VLHRINVRDLGSGSGRPLVFAHGYGCSQEMWRSVAPAFLATNRVILFDLVGAGGSDSSAYDPAKYDSLEGYAADLLEVLEATDARDAVIVGHSVSSMISVIAAGRDDSRIGALVLVGPSPRYTSTGDYAGGFERADIDALLDDLDANFLGWAHDIAPVMMGNPERPELARELETSFCRVDDEIARQFARVTFLSDNRDDLAQVRVPTLVLQCTDDLIAPEAVGRYVHEHIPGSELQILAATGHLPHLSGPDEVVDAVRRFVSRQDVA